MVDPEAAKRELLSAFKDVEDDGELLVAKPRGEVCDEPLSVEERYESEARFCILVRAKRDALLRRRAVQWESESANPILGHYWENEAGLDNGEKFLREYILNMYETNGWFYYYCQLGAGRRGTKSIRMK